MRSRQPCNEKDDFYSTVARRNNQPHRLQRADTSHPPKTVGWFFEHRDELAVALKACRDNPGELAKTPNCVNANEARNKVTVQEMKDALK